MSRLKLSLLLVLQALGVFALFRGLLFVAYYEEFSTLSLFEILQAFIYGLRFDFSLLASLFAIPLLMLNLPLKWFDNKVWTGFWYWLCLPLVIGICLLLAGDLVYYAYVKRHIAQELHLILNDSEFVLHMGLASYKLALLFFAIFAALLFLLWRKTLRQHIHSGSLYQRLAIFAILPFVLFIGIRGGIQGKPMHIIDAYATGNPSQGNLILNGAYSALRSFDQKPSVSHEFYARQQLEKQAREIGLYSNSPHYAFQKQYSDNKPTGLNVVMVLLESWSYKYIDALAGNNYGITPNFDKLVKAGLAFDHFYAAGQRSIDGLQAVLTSVPNLVDLPNLGWGLETSKFSRLGHIAQQHGYHTVFAQSSSRSSFHVDSIAGATGFQDYYGMEDMTLELKYDDPESFWYGWDHETFNKVYSRLNEISPPFLGFVFTGSTHGPYGTLPKRFLKHPHDANSEQGFMNTIYYADWAIGEFMKKARQQPWFDDTVFIFTADHTVGAYRSGNTLEQFHIPLLIYSPKHIKPGINSAIGSHFDIMPTIIDLLGIPDAFSSVGESLFRKRDNFAYIRAGNITGLISEQGYIRHTVKKLVDARTMNDNNMPAAVQKKLERRLLTIDQLAYQAIKSNNWAE
jgi:phosphoglycerol transferase MdoB-like AlkP superfamily enzyme